MLKGLFSCCQFFVFRLKFIRYILVTAAMQIGDAFPKFLICFRMVEKIQSRFNGYFLLFSKLGNNTGVFHLQ